MKFEYRKAEIGDAAGIAKVHVDAWRETYTGIVSQDYLDSLSYKKREEIWTQLIENPKPAYCLFVVTDSTDQIVGFADSGPGERNNFPYLGELYSMYLRKRVHGQGIGRKLFDLCVQSLRANHLPNMYVRVFAQNPTLAFYQHLGGCKFATETVEIDGAKHEVIVLGWDQIV